MEKTIVSDIFDLFKRSDVKKDDRQIYDELFKWSLGVAFVTAFVTTPLIWSYFDKTIPASTKALSLGWTTPYIATFLIEGAKFFFTSRFFNWVSKHGIPKGENRVIVALVTLLLLAGSVAFIGKSVHITTMAHESMSKRMKDSELATSTFDEANQPAIMQIDSALSIAYKAQASALRQTWRGKLTPDGTQLSRQANARIIALGEERKATVSILRAEHDKADMAAMSVFSGSMDMLSFAGGYAEAVYVLMLFMAALSKQLYDKTRKGFGSTSQNADAIEAERLKRIERERMRTNNLPVQNGTPLNFQMPNRQS